METARIVVEFLKIFLSPQVIIGAAAITFFLLFKEDVKALLRRIATIRFPGGEVSTSQAERTVEESPKREAHPPPPPEEVSLPKGLTLAPDDVAKLEELFKAERAKAYLWEYRYLNHFLVPHTQRVLDWLASLQERTSYGFFDSFWLPLIPSAEERRAIINALQAHHLIQLAGEIIEVTPKGREFIQWRGPLPPTP
jgi:hypothetical protein